jgi:hypothetical protein
MGLQLTAARVAGQLSKVRHPEPSRVLYNEITRERQANDYDDCNATSQEHDG